MPAHWSPSAPLSSIFREMKCSYEATNANGQTTDGDSTPEILSRDVHTFTVFFVKASVVDIIFAAAAVTVDLVSEVER
jgi:hypothetical protein